MAKIVVIFGSSRSKGATRDYVDQILSPFEAEVIDLNDHDISYYDYENKNQDDDFIGVMERVVAADILIFATPVYWYAMSAMMKTFFDRITDLLTIRKDLGRALAGKRCLLIASGGADSGLPEGFEVPFSGTCRYMDMSYLGSIYVYTGRDEVCIDKNAKEINGFQNLLHREMAKEGGETLQKKG